MIYLIFICAIKYLIQYIMTSKSAPDHIKHNSSIVCSANEDEPEQKIACGQQRQPRSLKWGLELQGDSKNKCYPDDIKSIYFKEQVFIVL